MSTEKEAEDKRLIKVSVCQACGGWVRASVLSYFQSCTKARNEFIREVIRHNLSVREISLSEWNKNKIDKCNCK
jgi:hypothetical protein